jgi:hypothetical protein
MIYFQTAKSTVIISFHRTRNYRFNSFALRTKKDKDYIV